ncbi:MULTISPECIES: hypothetical protein [Draconibacterium]|uniref:Transcription regulator TrmB N-terminal domain-containing protein n=1 Tax=Draconibacterium sediminis TaxID=1544798 RepID=A0A0D8JAD2_9BACT|nr:MULTISPECIES: hypothetical protein [Draconibacterium]KJF42733.1 hypothetical protein LH29_19605 [Draconibacterium sediminis]
MSKETIDIQKISNQFEKDILILLNEKEKYVYGDIIKDLKLSARRGQELISSLLNKGLVKRIDQSSYLKLNVDIK